MFKLLKLLAILVIAANSQVLCAADSIQGSIWSLTYSGSPLAESDPLTEIYRITLGADTSSHVGGNSFLDLAATQGNGSSADAKLFDVSGSAAPQNVTLTSPIPEPEIYAMMLAGLGLMGYVAHRRNSQGGAA